jgi:hypothetical protein
LHKSLAGTFERRIIRYTRRGLQRLEVHLWQDGWKKLLGEFEGFLYFSFKMGTVAITAISNKARMDSETHSRRLRNLFGSYFKP